MSNQIRRHFVDSYKPSKIQTPIESIDRQTRKNNELRPIRFEYNLIPNASGSVYAEYGNTKLVVAIYGPKQSRNLSTFSNTGRFQCHFHYAPFAFAERLTESRGRVIKEKDMASNIEKALTSVILLDKYPKCTIEAYVWLFECDGNTLGNAINTTSLALVNAGIEMCDFVSACQAVIIQNKDKQATCLLDATLSEERYVHKQCEMVVSFMNQSKQITLLNMNGSLPPQKAKDTVQVCFKACQQLKKYMKKSLYQQYSKQLRQKIKQ